MNITHINEHPRYAMVPAPRPRPPADDLTLTALHTAIRIAGLFAKYTAQRWGLPLDVADAAKRVATELITRAVEITGNPDPYPHWSQLGELHIIGIRVSPKINSLLVEVWDSDPTPPDGYDGHLSIVAKTSQQWNWYRPDGGGKVIWAKLVTNPVQPPQPLPQRTAGYFSYPFSYPESDHP